MPPDSSMYTRVLAAAALGACAVLFIVVLATSGGGDGDKDQQKAKGSQTKSGQSSRPRRATRPQGATYRVKAGDTLGSIAEKTGVGVEQLQERNPQLDPQTLVSGQKLKLRE